MAVIFYNKVEDNLLKFAVVITKYKDKFVFCKHRERTTYEVPGGHREIEETIDDCAARELQEETGATKFDIRPVCVYSVTEPGNFDEQETFGMLYFADIKAFEKELTMEIEQIVFLDEMPDNLTYPTIQPHLMDEARKRGFI